MTAALQQLVEQFADATHMQMESRIEAIDDVFPPAQVTHIYRLLQEALNNISKHAQAQRVQVLVERDLHVVRIVIADDGQGFDTTRRAHAGGLGLSSMTERAHMLGGSVTIQSELAAGTKVLIELPITEVEAVTDDKPAADELIPLGANERQGAHTDRR